MPRNEEALEDDPRWNAGDGKAVEVCTVCGNKIIVWHCHNTGCPWCAACRSEGGRE